MSERPAVCEPSDVWVYDDRPAISHWGWTHDPTTALCGESLIGVSAPTDHEPRCEECERLHLAWLASQEARDA